MFRLDLSFVDEGWSDVADLRQLRLDIAPGLARIQPFVCQDGSMPGKTWTLAMTSLLLPERMSKRGGPKY